MHDAVDEQPQAAFGWDPTRRSMRMGQQSPLLQRLHHLADRRWRQAHQPASAFDHRLPAIEVGLDHQPEGVAHAVGRSPIGSFMVGRM